MAWPFLNLCPENPKETASCIYTGPALLWSGIENGDSLNVALQKIDSAMMACCSGTTTTTTTTIPVTTTTTTAIPVTTTTTTAIPATTTTTTTVIVLPLVEVVVTSGSNGPLSCGSTTQWSVWIENGAVFETALYLYSDDIGTISGEVNVSDGTIARQWDGTQYVGAPYACSCVGYLYNITAQDCACSPYGSGALNNEFPLTIGQWYFSSATGYKVRIDSFDSCQAGFVESILDSSKQATCAEVTCV